MRIMIADRGTGEPISLGASLLAGKKVGPDVTNLLMEDHRIVLGWFEWYEQATDTQTKDFVARNICKALRAHMAGEEEVFYPAAERQTQDTQLVKRAVQEHQGAKKLMDSIESAGAADEAHAELMRELKTEIAAHVNEEETELFPEVRDSNMSLFAVGRAVAARRVDYLFEAVEAERGGAGRTAKAVDSKPARKKKASGKAAKSKATNGSRLKEIPTMQISADEARDYFVLGLKNAHATVKEGRTMVAAQVGRLEQYPKLKQKLESHLKEKDDQLTRLETILERCGESPSTLKDAGMTLMAGMSSLTSTAAADEVIKNSFATLGLAKFEAAAFETLILFGEAAGENDALRPLQQCLSEERGMAAFIEENLRATGMRFLQLKSQGAQASH